jgi:hypothetical protein
MSRPTQTRKILDFIRKKCPHVLSSYMSYISHLLYISHIRHTRHIIHIRTTLHYIHIRHLYIDISSRERQSIFYHIQEEGSHHNTHHTPYLTLIHIPIPSSITHTYIHTIDHTHTTNHPSSPTYHYYLLTH